MINDFLCLGWNPMPKTERIAINDAPRFMHGLRIAFAADFHIRRHTSDSYIASLIKMLGDTRADMLLLGGDYGEGIEAALRLFDALNSADFPMGIFAAAGNNDVEAFGNTENLRASMPFPLLVDEKLALRRNGGTLYIGGANEMKYSVPNMRGLFPRAGGASYSILISHYPHMHPFGGGARPRLMLSGHSHGGQIALFGVSCYTFGMEKGLVDRVQGLNKIGDTQLLVSSGIGVSRFPIRLGCPPRIHIIDFA